MTDFPPDLHRRGGGDALDLVGIGEASKFLGVSEKTLRQWDHKGKLVPVRTDGGHRRYSGAQLRQFLRDNEVCPSLTDEFLNSDLRRGEDVAKKALRFWTDRGYVQGDDDNAKTLAVLLHNQMEVNQMTTTVDMDDELTVRWLCQAWELMTARRLVHVEAMQGPVALYYYVALRGDNLAVESEAVKSLTGKVDITWVPLSPDEAEVVVLDQETFEPKRQKVNKLNAPQPDIDEIMRLNAQGWADDVSKLVFRNLWDNAKEHDGDWQSFLTAGSGPAWHDGTGGRWLVVGDYFLAVLRKLGLECREPHGELSHVGRWNDFEVFYGKNVEGVLSGPNPKPLMCGYRYFLYIPLTLTPTVLNPQTLRSRRGAFVRYGHAFTPGGKDCYRKLTF